MNDRETIRDIVVRTDENVKAIRTTQADHEVRIRSLEDSRARHRGALALLSGISSAVGMAIGGALEHFTRRNS